MTDSLIEIKTLEGEYATLINAYYEAYNNYKKIIENGQANEFTQMPGRSWWGTDGLTEGTVTSISDCATSCLNNKTCSGATFNQDNKYCWIRTGENSVSINTNTNTNNDNKNNIALITKLKASLILLNDLNDSMLNINSKISDKFKLLDPVIVQRQTDTKNKQKELEDSYKKLSDDKKQIQDLLDEYNSMDSNYSNTNLIANQNNSLFKFWLILACLVVLILFKVMYGDYLSYTFLFVTFIISLLIFSFELGLWYVIMFMLFGYFIAFVVLEI